MRYIDVVWHSARIEDPYRLVSELDERGYEVRKLEFFRSGAVGSASVTHESSETRLGTMPVPALREILEDPQFSGQAATPELFESLWQRYGRPLQPYEVVQLIAAVPEAPQSLVGTYAAVLFAYSGNGTPAYEIEFVASDATTIWYGTALREWLSSEQSPSVA